MDNIWETEKIGIAIIGSCVLMALINRMHQYLPFFKCWSTGSCFYCCRNKINKPHFLMITSTGIFSSSLNFGLLRVNVIYFLWKQINLVKQTCNLEALLWCKALLWKRWAMNCPTNNHTAVTLYGNSLKTSKKKS